MSRVDRSTRPETGAGPRASEELGRAAELAIVHAREALEASIRRRSALPNLTPDAMERIEHTVMRLELARSRHEMRQAELEAMRRLRVEERETAELERWIRQQAAAMLRDGWTPEELADIGIHLDGSGDVEPAGGGKR